MGLAACCVDHQSGGLAAGCVNHQSVGPAQAVGNFLEKKISLIKKMFINLRFRILAVTMELHCNGKHYKSQIIKIYLDQTDFFHKTDWLSLVLLYMWVTYELI